MGLDGGTIPSRSDILRRSSWALTCSDKTRSTRGGQINENNFKTTEKKMERRNNAKIRLSNCALTDEPLKSPIVACDLGNLYNKQALLEFILGKDRFENKKDQYKETFFHLKSLKSVFDIHPTLSKETEDLSTSTSSSSSSSSSSSNNKVVQIDLEGGLSNMEKGLFVCPITGADANGFHPFCALKKCGHCFSQKLFLQIKSQVCMLCSAPFSKEDIILLAPSEEQLDELKTKLRKRMKEEIESKESNKKNKKNNGKRKRVHDDNEKVEQLQKKKNLKDEVIENSISKNNKIK